MHIPFGDAPRQPWVAGMRAADLACSDSDLRKELFMWAIALAGFVLAILCVVAFIHGASIIGTGRPTTLDMGRQIRNDSRHQGAA